MATQTLHLVIQSGADDATQKDDGTGFTSSTTSVFIFGGPTADYRQNAGFRFTGVTIPSNAQIVSAVFGASHYNYVDPYFYTYAEATDNPVDFVANPTVTGRPRSAASVLMDATAYTLPVLNPPDLSALIQETISRPGWVSGNAITLLLIGGVNTVGRRMMCTTFEYGAIATLDITYNIGTTVTVTVNSAGNGTTTPAGAQVVTFGSMFTAVATPNPGYEFDHWEGGVTSTSPQITFQAYADTTITAVFRLGAAPFASFTATPSSGIGPLSVQFTDTSTPAGSATSWDWDFGDGSAHSTVQNPLHTYASVLAPTAYTVTLTATNAFGSTQAQAVITVQPTPTENLTVVGELILTPTFNSIGVRSKFSGDMDGDNQATLYWRRTGTLDWIPGMVMVPDRRATVLPAGDMLPVANPFVNEWRASIIKVCQPNTSYDVRVVYTDLDNGLTWEGIVEGTVITRNDDFDSRSYNGRNFYVSGLGNDTWAGTQLEPFATIPRGVSAANLPGDTVWVYGGVYPVTSANHILMANSGTDSAFITLRNVGTEGVQLDFTDSSGSADASLGAIQTTGSYIRVKGLSVTGGYKGFLVGPTGHDVVIEGNRISDGKISTSLPSPFYGIQVGDGNPTTMYGITITDNVIFLEEAGATTTPLTSGPGITFSYANGQNVIRRNRIIGVGKIPLALHGRDAINGQPNFAVEGTWQDTDIHDNMISGCTDDGISLDGCGLNMRVWGNTAERCSTILSCAPIIIGPAYFLYNLLYDGRQEYTLPAFMKGGEGSSGFVFLFHNTIVLDKLTVDGITAPVTYGITSWGGVPESVNTYLRNNIIITNGPICSTDNAWPDMDYDLLVNVFNLPGGSTSRTYWAKWLGHDCGVATQTNEQNLATFVARTAQYATAQEVHGQASMPVFVDRVNGDFSLAIGSPGKEQGAVIVGINDANSGFPYQGAAPDIGANLPAVAPLPPGAYFDYTPDTPQPAGTPIQFDSSFTSGTVTARDWNFGDNSPHATDVAPTHTYAAAGTYRVTFTATNAGGPSQFYRDVVVLAPIVNYTLDILTPQNGTTTPAPGTYSYAENSVIPITAQPAGGYIFLRWTEGGVEIGTANPIQVLMNGNRVILAEFIPVTPTTGYLVLTSSPVPASVIMDGSAVGVTPLQFELSPKTYNLLFQAAGYYDYPTSAPVVAGQTTTINAPLTKIPTPNPRVTTSAVGPGTVDPLLSNVEVASGTPLVVTAAWNQALVAFLGWTVNGTSAGTANPHTEVINADTTIVANFAALKVKLILTCSTGGGTTVNPALGTYEYEIGTPLSITALPATGSQYVQWWEGVTKLSDAWTLDITMDKERTIEVRFFAQNPKPPTNNTAIIVGVGAALVALVLLTGKGKK